MGRYYPSDVHASHLEPTSLAADVLDPSGSPGEERNGQQGHTHKQAIRVQKMTKEDDPKAYNFFNILFIQMSTYH